MFLPVRRAPCSDTLNDFILVAKDILLYSIETLTQTLDFASLEAHLKPELRKILEYKKVQNGVDAIFQLSFLDRVEAYEAFCENICFEQHINDEHYCFQKLSPEANSALGQLCRGLYSIIETGKIEKFNLRILQSQYTQENGESGKVCPVCVREILFCAGEGEADHYFPRTKYPALILHPYNLLPICSDCNGVRFKHTKNPINEQDIGPGELQTVFLPYLRAAGPEVELSVSEDCSRKVVISPKSETDKFTEKRIKNMERLFKLGERWSLILSNVYDDLVAELRDEATASLSKEEQLKKLRQLLLAHKNSTKNRIDFVKGVYCGWLDTKNDQDLVDMLLDSTALRTEGFL